MVEKKPQGPGLNPESGPRLAEINPDSVPRLAPLSRRGRRSLVVTDDEWTVLSLVDGTHSVGDLVRPSGLGVHSLIPLVERLARLGLVEIVPPSPPVPPPPSVPSQPPPHTSSGGRGSRLIDVEGPASPRRAGPRRPQRPRDRSKERTRSFDIVLVCTGNRFRSPLVEGFLRTLGRDLPVRVLSMGTQDLGPVTALTQAIDLGRQLGVDLAHHRARPLSRKELAEADLVVGFERAHVAAAVVEGGARHEVAFTLSELVDLLDGMETPVAPGSTTRAQAAVAAAHALRQRARHPVHHADITDPLGGRSEDYRRVARELRRRSVLLVEGLFGVAPTRGARR